MKTKITLISLLSILLLAGAFFVNDKNVAAKFFEKESSKSTKSLEDYSGMNNLKERIVAFNEEVPRNKSVLWRQNLIYYADRMDMNQEQKVWVNEAYDFMDENFFAIAGGDESEFIKTDLGKSYEKLMKGKFELFTREQGKKFCSMIGDDSTLTNSVQEGVVPPDNVCHCAGSWFCTECLAEEECSRSFCSQTSGGCGCALIWNCTKRCTVGLP